MSTAHRIAWSVIATSLAFATCGAASPESAPVAPPAAAVTPAEASTIAQEAYIYLYPIVLMDITRLQLTNADAKVSPIGGPANAFVHVRAFPAADMRAVVRPNFDTLYSSAWIDLTNGPVIVSTADTGGRYFLLPMLDMWTDVFAVPGQRTSGTGAASFALVGPGWTGALPANVERIDAPTPNVWIIGRTQTNGVKDYDAVHKVQNGYTITLLEDWGKTPPQPRKLEQKIDPAVDVKTDPMKQVHQMPAAAFFKYGAQLMKKNPPHATDWSIVARMKRIGLEPGRFEPIGIDESGLTQAAAAGLKLMRDAMPRLTKPTNGWQINTDTMGVYGNFYLKRAIIAMAGLGANQPDDAIYPLCIADADGKPVTAENKYVLRFAKSELPPVGAFWSLTMYDAEGFQVANAINRFAIGDRDSLKFNPDGSLDLYIQHENPGADKESNWLPSPKSGPLGLTLRLYAPKAEALNGAWTPPTLKRTK